MSSRHGEPFMTLGTINAFITLLYPSNKTKFKISKSRTSTDFIDHLRSIRNYIKKKKQDKTIHPNNR